MLVLPSVFVAEVYFSPALRRACSHDAAIVKRLLPFSLYCVCCPISALHQGSMCNAAQNGHACHAYVWLLNGGEPHATAGTLHVIAG